MQKKKKEENKDKKVESQLGGIINNDKTYFQIIFSLSLKN